MSSVASSSFELVAHLLESSYNTALLEAFKSKNISDKTILIISNDLLLTVFEDNIGGLAQLRAVINEYKDTNYNDSSEYDIILSDNMLSQTSNSSQISLVNVESNQDLGSQSNQLQTVAAEVLI